MLRDSPTINVMVNAARKASRGLLRDYGEISKLQVSIKGPADFVTNADIKAEEIIKEELQRARPGFGLILEESGKEVGRDKEDFWIVDPLDGTMNFLHGLPHFAISIAHESKGEILSGVIFDPLRNEIFYSAKGLGAYSNDGRIRVSNRKELNDSVFSTGIPCIGKDRHPAYLKILDDMMKRSAGIRRFGAASLDLAYVAAGRYEGFWETDLKYWDVAAGSLLVQEAGGYISGIDGKKDFLKSGNILATNSHLNIEIRKIFKQIVGEKG
ncbi:MAG: inositol monophosphatase [Rickettsiales bacterium]|nr:inositol monophosphatase [Rickettsiales bacterium]